jgi:hypothetical protein
LLIDLNDPIAAWTVLALALLGLAIVWATQLWSGKFKWFDRIAFILGLIILMTLVLLAAVYDSAVIYVNDWEVTQEADGIAAAPKIGGSGSRTAPGI